MRILIDENLPRHLKRILSEHEPSTVQEMGWTGVRNSELLAKAETAFDVLLTADKNLRYQQNLEGIRLALIVFPSNRLGTVKDLTEPVKEALSRIEPGQIIELSLESKDPTNYVAVSASAIERAEGRTVVRLRVPLREALVALDRVEHSTFATAVDRYWNVGSDGQVTAQSVCWLFCWGKTGMNSDPAAEAARRAFNEVLDISFEAFDARVPHEWARHARYELGNIEAELSRLLAEPEK